MNNSLTNNRGFTLFELLLVILLMAIIVSTVRLPNITTSVNEEIETEARRLAVLTELASEFSVLNNQMLGLFFDKTSYEFLIFDGSTWLPIGKEPFQIRELPEFITYSLNLDGLPWQEQNLLNAIDWQQEDQDDFSLETDDDLEEKKFPQVFILPSGELSSFEIIFDAEDADQDVKRVYVRGKFTAPLVVQREDELDDW